MPSPDAGSGGDGEQEENEGHRGNRDQANKLSRTHAALLDALDRHRGKGQQKVTVAGPSPVGIATIKSDSCQRLTVRIRRRPPFRKSPRVRTVSPLIGELA